MALCPACFKNDKEFFATTCHNCNSRIPFTTQVLYSTLSAVFTFGAFFGILWLIFG